MQINQMNFNQCSFGQWENSVSKNIAKAIVKYETKANHDTNSLNNDYDTIEHLDTHSPCHAISCSIDKKTDRVVLSARNLYAFSTNPLHAKLKSKIFVQGFFFNKTLHDMLEKMKKFIDENTPASEHTVSWDDEATDITDYDN